MRLAARATWPHESSCVLMMKSVSCPGISPAKPVSSVNRRARAMEMNYRTTRIQEGRRRVVIEGVTPEIDAGRLAIKRTPGGRVSMEADIFTDWHDTLCALVKDFDLLRPLQNSEWGGSAEHCSTGNARKSRRTLFGAPFSGGFCRSFVLYLPPLHPLGRIERNFDYFT